MKKKTGSSDVVTKDYLDETLDIRFSLFEDKIVRRIGDAITESHSKLYARIDPLLSELEDRRLDREIGTEQVQKLKGRVDNHELRIKKLENN